jgi:hypothetical protein
VPAGRPAPRPCGRGHRPPREPACCRTLDASRACSCGHAVPVHRRDRTRPACHHDRPARDRRVDRHRPERHRSHPGHRDDRRHHRRRDDRRQPVRPDDHRERDDRDRQEHPGQRDHPGRSGRCRPPCRARAGAASSPGWYEACRGAEPGVERPGRPRVRPADAAARRQPELPVPEARRRRGDPGAACPASRRTGCCRAGRSPADRQRAEGRARAEARDARRELRRPLADALRRLGGSSATRRPPRGQVPTSLPQETARRRPAPPSRAPVLGLPPPGVPQVRPSWPVPSWPRPARPGT